MVKKPGGPDQPRILTHQAATARDIVPSVDTAGRQHTKIQSDARARKGEAHRHKLVPGAPDEVLLVLDATTGQNADQPAKF